MAYSLLITTADDSSTINNEDKEFFIKRDRKLSSSLCDLPNKNSFSKVLIKFNPNLCNIEKSQSVNDSCKVAQRKVITQLSFLEQKLDSIITNCLKEGKSFEETYNNVSNAELSLKLK